MHMRPERHVNYHLPCFAAKPSEQHTSSIVLYSAYVCEDNKLFFFLISL